MKKLLGISVVAMLAVSPMMANADPTQYTDTTATTGGLASTATGVNVASQGKYYKSATITTDDQSHIASTAYVKGAYNSAVGMINKIAADSATDAGEGLVKSNGKFSVDLKKQDINNVSTNVSGLKLDGTGDAAQLMVDADGSTVEINATSHKVGVKAGGITSTELHDDAVTTAKIAAGNVTFDKMAAAAVVASTDNSGEGMETTVANANDDKLVTEKAVAKALATVASDATTTAGDGIDKTGTVISVKLKDSSSGLDFDSNGKLGVDVGSTITVGANGLEVADTSLTVGKINTNDLVNSANATYSGSTDLVQQGYVDEAVATLQGGVATTINNSTVSIYTTWGDDSSQNATTTVYVDAPQGGYTTTPRS